MRHHRRKAKKDSRGESHSLLYPFKPSTSPSGLVSSPLVFVESNELSLSDWSRDPGFLETSPDLGFCLDGFTLDRIPVCMYASIWSIHLVIDLWFIRSLGAYNLSNIDDIYCDSVCIFLDFRFREFILTLWLSLRFDHGMYRPLSCSALAIFYVIWL